MLDSYDAVLVVSFGGPDQRDDVLPFLENVLRGRNVPRERMLEVAEHYYHFGGRSPINDQNRALIAALEKELATRGPKLPVYWGNRNWHPLLEDTLRQMAVDGVRRALAFFTSAYSSYSGCRQYRENIAAAQRAATTSLRAVHGPWAAEGQPAQLRLAPEIDKLRVYFNHPGFIEPMVESVLAALDKIPAQRRENARLIFTAHSIPTEMAVGCLYEEQLREACRLVAEGVGRSAWRLVYQSRSGPLQQPWLEPDICDSLREMASDVQSAQSDQRSVMSRTARRPNPGALPDGKGMNIIVVPIGFISDHLEVLYDLDTEAQQLCEELGVNMVRAATVGTHPRFIQMIRELIEERMTDSPNRLALGTLGPSHDFCPESCCLYVPRRPTSTK